MKKKILKNLLLLIPVVVLSGTLIFINYTVQYFRDTAYTFVYNTNVETVQSFSRELSGLSSQGYTSAEYSHLFTNMIQNFKNEVGAKKAIVTVLLDEDGQFHHSSETNQAYLSELIQGEESMDIISEAFESRSNGEITLKRTDNSEETLYHHQFYSGPTDYTLFICVDRSAVEAQLHANGVVIPISVIGLLLLITIEYTIWLKLDRESDEEKRKDGERDDD